MAQSEFWVVALDRRSDGARTINLALENAGYPSPRYFADPALALAEFDGFRPAFIIVRLNSPSLAELAFVRSIRSVVGPGVFLPVLAIGDVTVETVAELAVDAGISDFLAEPLTPYQILSYVGSLIRTSARARYVRRLLRDTIKAVGAEPGPAHYESIARLGQAGEHSDDGADEHAARVGRLSGDIAHELGLPPAEAQLIGLAAPLHDLGKAFVAHRVLSKEGEFVPFERKLMQQHVSAGTELLKGESSSLARAAEIIVRSHHERWDGKGYPAGLSGMRIPLSGRIVAVAEAFEAMTHLRPYKAGVSVGDALAEIREQRDRQFDPNVVHALLRIQDRLLCLASHLFEGRAAGL